MSLKQKTISGIGWNGAGNIARQILQVITLVVMARFLSPGAFGVYAILMVFVTFMNVIASMGTSQVVIYMDNPSQRMLSSIFYFNIGIGITLFALFFFLAWPIADYFENENLVHLLQIIGLIFIISSLSLVQKALLEKNLLFKWVVILETTAFSIGSAAGITGAVLGLGIYSLLIIALAKPGVFSLGLWLSSHWRPSLKFAFSDIKYIWNYSFYLTGFTFINYFARNADDFLIGKFIGSSALGMYSVAYKIMLYPLENISRVLVRVMFPAFSRLKKDNPQFKNAYVKTITFIAMVTFPVMMGLFAVSETFVGVFLGDKWEGMAALLMILAPVGMVQSIVTTVGSIFTAKGTTGLMFKIGSVNAVVTILSFVIGLPYGVQGVAMAYAVANAIMLYPNLKFAWNQIDLDVLEGLGKVSPFFITSIIMSITLYFQGLWLSAIGLNEFAVLPTQIVTGVLIYVGILMVFYKRLVLELIDELRRKKSSVTTS